MTLMKAKILSIGKSTISGRVYSEEVIREAIDQWKARDKAAIFGELRNSAEINNSVDNNLSMTNVSHIVESITIESDGVYATIRALETPRGRQLQELVEADSNNVSLFPVMSGVVTKDAVVSDLSFVRVDVHSKEPDKN